MFQKRHLDLRLAQKRHFGAKVAFGLEVGAKAAFCLEFGTKAASCNGGFFGSLCFMGHLEICMACLPVTNNDDIYLNEVDKTTGLHANQIKPEFVPYGDDNMGLEPIMPEADEVLR
jgi:hypothetical protein